MRPVVTEFTGDNDIAVARECLLTEITKRTSHESNATDRRGGIAPNMGTRIEDALSGRREITQKGLFDFANGSKARHIGFGDMFE
mgnify:CR=1 FL=1